MPTSVDTAVEGRGRNEAVRVSDLGFDQQANLRVLQEWRADWCARLSRNSRRGAMKKVVDRLVIAALLGIVLGAPVAVGKPLDESAANSVAPASAARPMQDEVSLLVVGERATQSVNQGREAVGDEASACMPQRCHRPALPIGVTGLALLLGLALLCLVAHFFGDRLTAWVGRQDSLMLARTDANQREHMRAQNEQAERDRTRQIANRATELVAARRQDLPR